ncbi:MAG: type VI secretion system-associated protein TagO [Planctomycetota bacterium]|jgi:type VI secretion system protein VasI
MIRVTVTLVLSLVWPGVLEAQANLEQEVAKCAAISNDLERLVCYDELARAQGFDRQQARSVPTGGVGAWEIRDQVNPLDDTRTVNLALVSTSGGSTAGRPVILVLRCESGETEVYVNWRVRVASGAQVATRIGTDEVERRRWSLSSNQQATFYPSNDVDFIRALMTADRFVAQVTLYSGNPVTAIFDTQGIDNAVRPLRQSCGW